ncbi:hypothetical protein BKA80DRAFT_262541 [Phyllosticta citrichinensis]
MERLDGPPTLHPLYSTIARISIRHKSAISDQTHPQPFSTSPSTLSQPLATLPVPPVGLPTFAASARRKPGSAARLFQTGRSRAQEQASPGHLIRRKPIRSCWVGPMTCEGKRPSSSFRLRPFFRCHGDERWGLDVEVLIVGL